MFDGSEKKVQEIAKGDFVLAASGKPATVLCIVKTLCTTGRTKLVRVGNGLLVTPFHPIRIDGKWCFPCDVAPMEEMDCAAVYSFVLDAEHTMVINGIECVSLGHGICHQGFAEDGRMGQWTCSASNWMCNSRA
jgi:hypothetical protein